MTAHTVIISYISRTNVEVAPDPVAVDEGDTIEFVPDRRPGRMIGKMRVTFDEKEFFDTDKSGFAGNGVFHQGDGLVRVKTKPPQTTTYVCELLDENDVAIARSDGKKGGSVDPVRPG